MALLLTLPIRVWGQSREAAQPADRVIGSPEMKKAMLSVVLDDEDAHEERAGRNRLMALRIQ
jgi:hypothetical protein